MFIHFVASISLQNAPSKTCWEIQRMDMIFPGSLWSPWHAQGNESRLLVDDDEKFVRNGEPTEAAIRVLVEKLGCPDEALNQNLGFSSDYSDVMVCYGEW